MTTAARVIKRKTTHPTHRARRALSQSEQLTILTAALVFGLLGSMFHALWLVSVLLMTLIMRND